MKTSLRLALLVGFMAAVACTATHGSLGYDEVDPGPRGEGGSEAGGDPGSSNSGTGNVIWIVTAGGSGTGGYTSAVTEPLATGGFSATPSGEPSNCSNATNFIDVAAASPNGDLVGGDGITPVDSPCAVQGRIFAYSDVGLDGIAGTLDDAVQWPAFSPTEREPEARNSPCSEGKCCAVGRTYDWPISPSGIDYTAPVWGGGIGIELGNGLEAAETRHPYNGPARGFIIKLSGEIHGQELRVAYNRTHADAAAPYVTVGGLGMLSVLFSDVRCPTWSSEPCNGPSAHPYEMLVQVAGGVAGTYTLCVEGIWPIL